MPRARDRVCGGVWRRGWRGCAADGAGGARGRQRPCGHFRRLAGGPSDARAQRSGVRYVRLRFLLYYMA